MKPKISYSAAFWIASLAIALAKIIFLLRPEIDLFTEEAQYWLWSKNLAWHYYSKPPLVAYLNFLSTSVFGINEFAVRLIPIIFGMGTSWITFRFGSYLHGEKIGFWSAMILQAMPFWWMISTFHTTDTALTFFWTATFYLLFKALKENKKRFWVFAGITAAIGLMAKAAMLLVLPFLILYLIQEGKFGRRLKNLILFTLLLSLGFIPILVWNFQNDFITFKHLANLAGAGEGQSSAFSIGKSLESFGGYLEGQLAMVSVFLLPLIFGAIKQVFKFRSQEKFYLILPALLTFFGFGFLSLFKEALVNWPVFTYAGLAILSSAWVAEQTDFWRKMRNYGVAISLGLPLLILLPDITFFKSIPPIKKGEKQLFKRMSGYDPLAERVEFLQDSLQLDEVFIFSETYHMASELSFYLEAHPQTYMLNMGARKNQFDLWPGMEQFVGKDNTGIFVSWNYDSPGEFAEFDSLLYEEKFQVYFRGDSLRAAKIQVWKNLKEFNPYQPETY
ncbi:ArnT family glycosyltransferase [Algoriphagus pacificus]|uniref:Glycosyltransferase family 39 protein n=1 Tax=Algoriphagus pacificus TaxID=2811234 RepID=A0ABS3CCM7_9BACT|nr:glycosyltransferase family 39 protein [Algoriphagus pacificus]MBN7814853.1 glycosyltransferase family 39 protein [Algoriphagus pacificus]